MRCARGGRSTFAMTLITGASAALGRAFAEALPLGTGPVLTARVYGLKAELAQP